MSWGHWRVRPNHHDRGTYITKNECYIHSARPPTVVQVGPHLSRCQDVLDQASSFSIYAPLSSHALLQLLQETPQLRMRDRAGEESGDWSSQAQRACRDEGCESWVGWHIHAKIQRHPQGQPHSVCTSHSGRLPPGRSWMRPRHTHDPALHLQATGRLKLERRPGQGKLGVSHLCEDPLPLLQHLHRMSNLHERASTNISAHQDPSALHLLYSSIQNMRGVPQQSVWQA